MSAESYLKDTYLRYLRSHIFDSQFGTKWKDRDQAQAVFERAFDKALSDLGFDPTKDASGLVSKVIDDTIQMLKDSAGLLVEGDSYTGEFWKLDVTAKDNTINSYLNTDSISIRVGRLGNSARLIALSRVADELRWPEAAVTDEEDEIDAENTSTISAAPPEDWMIPASDRIVSRTDNLPQIDEIHEAIGTIRRELAQDNHVGDTMGDDREVVDSELQVAEQVVESSRFRVRSLMGWLLPALRYLAEKFTSSAVSEAAKHLWNLLVSLL